MLTKPKMYVQCIGVGICIWLVVMWLKMDQRTYFIGIKSGYASRRAAWRNSSCVDWYAHHDVPYKFFIGVPIVKGHDLTAHHQGAYDRPEERVLERALEQEALAHDDMYFLPFRDQYMDITLKTIGILKFALENTRARYIIIHDDEYCADMKIIRELPPSPYLYAGYSLFQGTEYSIMKGPEGDVSPFFSGACSMLSRPLVAVLLGVDAVHTFMYGYYGTSSDDSNIGRWVKWAQEQHDIVVDYQQAPMLITDLKNVPAW